jgi:hypothetical protein
MINFLRYNLFNIFSILIYPLFLFFESFLSLVKGELFPIDLRFGTTCGPLGDYTSLGNGEAWLVIIISLTILAIKLITKKPKNFFLMLLIIYITMFLVHFISYFIGGAPPEFCM